MMGDQPGQQQHGTLTMSHLPKDPTQPSSSGLDWSRCLGNMESATVAVDTFRALMQDAVFLDEDAYTNAATLQNYQSRLAAQARRINTLEAEVTALREEVAGLQQDLGAARDSVEAANSRVRDLQSELDNNAVVFDMHYNELMLKNDEIARMKAIIEGLGGPPAGGDEKLSFGPG